MALAYCLHVALTDLTDTSLSETKLCRYMQAVAYMRARLAAPPIGWSFSLSRTRIHWGSRTVFVYHIKISYASTSSKWRRHWQSSNPPSRLHPTSQTPAQKARQCASELVRVAEFAEACRKVLVCRSCRIAIPDKLNAQNQTVKINKNKIAVAPSRYSSA